MGEWSSSEVAFEVLVFPACCSTMEGAAACQGQTCLSNPAKRAKLSFWWFYHVTRLWGLNFSMALATGTALLVYLLGASGKPWIHVLRRGWKLGEMMKLWTCLVCAGDGSLRRKTYLWKAGGFCWPVSLLLKPIQISWFCNLYTLLIMTGKHSLSVLAGVTGKGQRRCFHQQEQACCFYLCPSPWEKSTQLLCDFLPGRSFPL